MDRTSLEELYRTYGPSVRRRARALLADDQAAADAVQEVFVRALRAEVMILDGVSPMTWFYRVTTNYCLNALRNQRRRLRAIEREHKEEAAAPIAEDRIAVREVLAKVPDELGQVAIYYYFDQMKQEEIAALLGVSRRTIGNRLEEFRKLARLELDEGIGLA